jgi:putative aldouronate transport system permease protein
LNLNTWKADALVRKPKKSEIVKHLIKHRWLYVMMIPGILYFLIFRYIPMLGIVISFQDYQPFLGFSGSKWVGLKHFYRLFTDETFFVLLKNTLMLFLYGFVFAFPVPIILALLLNEIRKQIVKRLVQTVIYMPHFLSWVIVVSLTHIVLTTEGGIVNDFLEIIGREKINFMLSESWFRPLYTIQSIWRDAGWGTIIYLAAITGVDPSLYEAARMDGANRFRLLWHITLPGIRSVIVILSILKMGDIMDLSFDHVFLMLNAMNRNTAEVFDTYVYTVGILGGQFSYSTTVGLFKSVAGLIMVLMANRMAKKFGEEGIW